MGLFVDKYLKLHSHMLLEKHDDNSGSGEGKEQEKEKEDTSADKETKENQGEKKEDKEKKDEDPDKEKEATGKEKEKKDAKQQVDVKELLTDINDRDKQIETLSQKVEEYNTLVTEHNETKETLQGYENVLKSIAETKLEQVPEDYHDLIPDSGVLAQLEWLNKAEAKGLFKADKSEQPIGRQTTANKQGKKEETENLSAINKISNALKEHYSK